MRLRPTDRAPLRLVITVREHAQPAPPLVVVRRVKAQQYLLQMGCATTTVIALTSIHIMDPAIFCVPQAHISHPTTLYVLLVHPCVWPVLESQPTVWAVSACTIISVNAYQSAQADTLVRITIHASPVHSPPRTNVHYLSTSPLKSTLRITSMWCTLYSTRMWRFPKT